MMTEEESKSRMYIEFEGPNSTMFTMKVENVTALQFLTLSNVLRIKAEFLLNMQEAENWEQERSKHIQVAQPKIEIGRK